MENLSSLPVEKQNILIDAALNSFGTNGYKKTSMNDIAAAAGISKALVFHYFGTKKALYLYLVQSCTHTVRNEVAQRLDPTVTDFFDRVRLAIDIGISVMKQHPAILFFLDSVIYEDDDEIKADLVAIRATDEGGHLRSKIGFEGADTSKFKADVDPKLVMEIFRKLIYGYLGQKPPKTGIDLDALHAEFDQYITLFKRNFYQEKYR